MAVRYLLFISILFSFSLLHGQEKLEREYRLKIEEVPQKSLSFVKSHRIKSRIKWYFEENLLGNSIEAKFKFEKQKYSIEFDTLGNFQDIEINVDFASLPDTLKRKINTIIQEKFDNTKIKKVQSQYSDKLENFEEFLSINNQKVPLSLNYEIVVKGKKDRIWQLYELTFDDLGNLKDSVLIIQRNTDNLEY